tara:strand:- start:3263 stop:4054 length:792 start_codon:yes stop_codon:yes gene_type:complete
MKNIVFMLNIKTDSGVLTRDHTSAFEYGVKSWSKWCEKNQAQHVVLTEPIHESSYMVPNWQKWYVYDLLDNDGIEYDKILVVDADTIIHPDCPNFFEMTTDDELGLVVNDGCYEWVRRDIKNYSLLFDDIKINQWEYFNSGFMLLDKSHKKFIKSVLDWYHTNNEAVNEMKKKSMTSTEQGPLNYLTRMFDVKLKFLPTAFNLQDMFRKNLLYHNPRCWWPDELLFLDCGWIYHYNAIGRNELGRDLDYWMQRTYHELYGSKL